MSEISFEEFLKLSEKEKCERYKDLSNHDRFLARMSFTGGAVATGETFKLTEEDKKEIEEERKKWKETCKELHEQRRKLEEQRKKGD